MNRRAFLKLAAASAAAPLASRLQLRTWRQFPPGVVCRLPTGWGWAALTIDDGWSRLALNRMAEELAAYRAGGETTLFAGATWFLAGTGIDDAAEAFEYSWETWGLALQIAYHSLHHPELERVRAMSVQDWMDDIDGWRRLTQQIAKTSLLRTHLVRPWARAPGGLFTPEFLEACRRKYLLPIGWSQEPWTWNRGKPLADGQIILAHARMADVEYVRQVLSAASRQRIAVTGLLELEGMHHEALDRADSWARPALNDTKEDGWTPETGAKP